jgi:hypothetical protein
MHRSHAFAAESRIHAQVCHPSALTMCRWPPWALPSQVHPPDLLATLIPELLYDHSDTGDACSAAAASLVWRAALLAAPAAIPAHEASYQVQAMHAHAQEVRAAAGGRGGGVFAAPTFASESRCAAML